MIRLAYFKCKMILSFKVTDAYVHIPLIYLSIDCEKKKKKIFRKIDTSYDTFKC